MLKKGNKTQNKTRKTECKCGNVQLNTRNKKSYLLSTQTLLGPLDSNNSSLSLNTIVEASVP